MTRDWNPHLPEMPVDEKGNWMDYPYGWPKLARWETVHQPFYAEFTINGMRTGRSSKKVILEDTRTGKFYPMFVGDMVKGIQEGNFLVAGGIIKGYWTGSKRGANYGIKAVKVEV